MIKPSETPKIPLGNCGHRISFIKDYKDSNLVHFQSKIGHSGNCLSILHGVISDIISLAIRKGIGPEDIKNELKDYVCPVGQEKSVGIVHKGCIDCIIKYVLTDKKDEVKK